MGGLTCPACGDQIPEGWMKTKDKCRDCWRHGAPDPKKVPFKEDDVVHVIGSPRTPYRVVEVLPATNSRRRGGASLLYAGKPLKRHRNNPPQPYVYDNHQIVEWRQANLSVPSQPRLMEHVIWATREWTQRAAAYLQKYGDQGTCVIGAGIEILGIKGERLAFIPAPGGQGASTWEESEGDIVSWLRHQGLDAYYRAGRMD